VSKDVDDVEMLAKSVDERMRNMDASIKRL
jgi:hypothetical protein